MITPPKLKPGDAIGIVAPARKIEKSDIEPAVKILEQWGLYIVFGKNLFNQERQFAGTDKERADDIQLLLDDSNIKAIFCARGGYGTIKTLRYLDFTRFVKKPKWIIGYSDITALHAHLHNLGIKSIHGIMPLNFPADGLENEATESLKKLLFGDTNTYKFNAHPFNKTGKSKGAVVGGNLSVLYSIAGTKYDIDTDYKILFLEDLDEYLYHIDRMMMNLKLSGKLDKLNGLIVGGMTDMNDNTIPFGKTAYEIIRDAVADYDYPVCYQFPAGHINNNLALVFGAKITVDIGDQEVNVMYMD
ncbi:MAG TPA: LD-carboxypeptidase [Bacteroidales bacterium]|nr:LD-carboxypeptidase [Bacteroidales bacterium]